MAETYWLRSTAYESGIKRPELYGPDVLGPATGL
jgi:hypothetical protein